MALGTYRTTFADFVATSSDATSTVVADSSAGTTTPVDASSTPTDAAGAPSDALGATATYSSDSLQATSSEAVYIKPSQLVHVVGIKYTDYFTDGTTTYSFPGDPAIDANLNQPNAPIPTHDNLIWVSSSGREAYDTPSGDLEPGTYAQEADGSFIANSGGKDGVAFSKTSPVADTVAPADSADTMDASSTVSLPMESTLTDTTTPQMDSGSPSATSGSVSLTSAAASSSETVSATSTDQGRQ